MTKEAKQFWNERAAQFFQHQRIGEEAIPNAVANWLHERVGDEVTIADIGSGSGRYALVFAPFAERVVALDVSDEMLRLLEGEATRLGHSNVVTMERGWPTNMEQVDVAFAAMCPAVGSETSLRAMDDTARQLVVIARYDYTSDQWIEQLSEESQRRLFEGDPHNDATLIDEMERIANTSLHRTPERVRFTHEETERMPVEQAIARYAKYEKRAPAEYATLTERLREAATDGEVDVTRKFGLTLLYWSTTS